MEKEPAAFHSRLGLGKDVRQLKSWKDSYLARIENKLKNRSLHREKLKNQCHETSKTSKITHTTLSNDICEEMRSSIQKKRLATWPLVNSQRLPAGNLWSQSIGGGM